MSHFLRIITLSFLIILTLYTRLWQIAKYPPSLFSDEVDAGYQAMVFNYQRSDYFNNRLPLHFHSFADWRTPLYIYSISIFQKFFNYELSVRLPSSIFGIFSVLIFYLLTKSYIATFLFIISPWAIHYSRTGFEVSGMILMLLLGIYFFQLFSKKKKYYLLLISSFFYCLSPYFYSTAKFFIIIIILISVLLWYKHLFLLNVKKIIILIIFIFLLLVPLIKETAQGKGGYRFSYISIFTKPHREQITDKLRYEDILISHEGQVGVKTPFLSYILHNKYQLVFDNFITNYFSSFSTNFLCLTGDSNLRQGFINHGVIYFIDYFLIIYGIFISFKTKNNLNIFFFLLLLLSPIPFSLTRDSLSPHSTRLILMLPSLIFFSYITVRKIPILLFLYPFLFINFWHLYTIHYPQNSARDWHSGMKEVILATNDYPQYKIIFSNSYESFLPFFLFYKKYLPFPGFSLSSQLIDVQNDLFSGYSLDNHYYFGHINPNYTSYDNSYLYILPGDEYFNFKKTNKFKEIKYIPKKYLSSQDFYFLIPEAN